MSTLAPVHELDRDTYLQLKRQLDFRPRALPGVLIVLLDAALITASWHLLRVGEPLQAVLSQLLLAVVAFNAFSILHDCGHGSFSRVAWINALVGHVASVLCFIPYYPWKYIHQQHHAHTGSIDQDPVLKSLRRWRDRGVSPLVRFGWRSWVPIGALMQHLVYWSYPLEMRARGELDRSRALRCAVSTFVPLLAYALIVWTVLPQIDAAWLLLGFVFFLALEEIVNIPHHADVSVFDHRLPIWQQHLATRSCDYPPVLSELIVLNFNFHIEHHLFPALPWYRLRRARALVKPALGEHYQEAVGISWNLERRGRSLEEIVARYRKSD